MAPKKKPQKRGKLMGKVRKFSKIPATSSLKFGIFFEHVSNQIGNKNLKKSDADQMSFMVSSLLKPSMVMTHAYILVEQTRRPFLKLLQMHIRRINQTMKVWKMRFLFNGG